ncbi:MAG: tetratricopeptide repeat protein [Microcystis sp. M_OC_Ca_00000000_C217Col]|uniref:CHAT domain-containing protein n=1 Tax=Microcystis sp. M_OC_Ca_00000000_C217Col TaxID=2486213 RepID=UPI00119323C4|nr:CHAT domain-containing protein [Microcystis sp. M_OC_Ca_00000000_C217Col]TRT94379.1 MAG: tetratricopeptide repeat protein [Microcystis sp. M_OC_Ca_00000000_C217Col]
MVAVAQQYGNAGRENEARWLLNMAQQLAEYISRQKFTIEEYKTFLLDIVLAANKSNSDVAIIYPILKQHQDKLDDTFAKLLQIYARNMFSQRSREESANIAGVIHNLCNKIKLFPLNFANNQEIAIVGYQTTLEVYTRTAFPKEWAITQNSLGIAYCDRIKGTKADNLELAIFAFQQSLEIYTRSAFPKEWAAIQNNLGEAYRNRIKEKKADNIELAIAAFQQSLEIYTREAFSYDWAVRQNNLGIAYYERIKGAKADNLELAIFALEQSLEVHTRDTFPEDWANAQSNLGNIYLDRIKGDKADNLELSIAAYLQALEVFTCEAFPKDWATIQNNLGNVYCDRIKGEKADNLEFAIVAYQKSLEVRNRETFPEDWANTQNNLGTVYRDRIKGNKSDNLELAINAYQQSLAIHTYDAFPQKWALTQVNLGNAYSNRLKEDKTQNLELAIIAYNEALKVRTFDAFPQEWATTQNNLANAYRDRIREEKADNLEKAITAYHEALKVLTFDAFPQEWAMTQNNLANAYSERIRGEKAENLERAITALHQALKVRTFDAFPQEWAMTQYNLATAYFYRIRGEKAENLEKVIASYQNALTIRTKDAAPLDCLLTARNLANLHYDEKQWQSATEAYHIAIEAVENARLEALNPQNRQETLSNAIDVFHRIVLAHLNLNQPEKALEYIERSKGRNLVELMTQKNLQPQGVSQQIKVQLDELKQRVVNEQIRLQHQSINHNSMRSDNLTPYVQDHSHLKEYQQDLDDFIAREIKDPLFSLTQKVEPIPFTEIQALTDAETCLLQWYITFEKILAFVVSADGDVKYWQSSEDDIKQFFDTFSNYRQLYYSKNGKQEWRNQLSNLLHTFADTLHINDILALIPDTCQRLIIIPHWFLHILPIHAFPINKNQILQDKYNIQYAPSCQILQKITQTSHHSDFNKLFAIQNPTKDLFYTDLEVNILSTFFTESQVIAKDNATKNAVLPHLKSSDNHCYHFSCHGSFNPDNPLESALFLANKEPLTLGEIFELRLNKCRLITLSACETGLIDLNSISDEYIGLPSGFLFAGSPSVVSSLWTLNDLSTSFLMIKLYEILFDENQQVSVPVALKTAQNWLQNLTIEELDKFLEQYQPQIDKHLAQLRPGQRLRYEQSLKLIKQRQPHPFISPYYWAGFIATGI